MATAAPDARPRTFPCESCGADLVIAKGARALACSYCGFEREIALDDDAEIRERDLLSELERQAAQRAEASPPEDDTHAALCEACGAEVTFQGRMVTRHCAWCGSAVQQRDAHRGEGRIPVDAVVPFGVRKEWARRFVSEWLSKLWFAPNDFLGMDVPERLQGVYLPYWTFDAATFNRYVGERGKVYYRGSGKHRVRKVRWRPARGSFQHFIDDLPVPADGTLPTELRRALEPWPFERALPFDPALLAGQLSRTYALPLAEGWKRGKQRMEERLAMRAKLEIGGDEQRVHELATRWDALSYKHVLLPVYLMAMYHRGQLYTVIVNGATGEVAGERPWSAAKIALAATAAAALIVAYLSVR